jgi:hypothetical protein
MRHLAFPLIAARWHGFPARFFAPQRRARRKGKGSRVGRSMGLPFNFSSTPAPRCGADITDNCLSTGVDMNVLDANLLLAATPELR